MTKLNEISPSELPNINHDQFNQIDCEQFIKRDLNEEPLKFLILYGSLRERSYSRFIAQEANRLVRFFGGETRIFNPRGLPLTDSVDASHEKVQELRDSATWSEGMIWYHQKNMEQ